MLAAKAFWQVQAGLVPGQPMAQYDRVWSYTSEDYEFDSSARGARFHEMKRCAHEYAHTLESGGLNWVSVSYAWV